MSDAYKCDRCGEYGDDPALKVESYSYTDAFVVDGQADQLCEPCGDEYVEFWQEYDNDD